MKRRFAALCLSFLMLLSFTACGSEKAVMTVSGENVPEGVVRFYLDKVMSAPESYGVKENTREEIISATEKLCREYAVTIAFMKENGVTLSVQRKQNSASEVESRWNLFGEYYKGIGIEKTDITKVVTHEYRMKQLVDYYFGSQGKNPVKEMELKEEFVDLYVGFKAVTGSLTKTNDAGETVVLTEKEKNSLKSKFNSLASKINNGDITIDEANVSYNDSLGLITTGELEMNLVKIGDPVFGEDFYETVMDISHDRAAVTQDGNTLYLVQRQKIATSDDDAFAEYRTQVLETVKMPEVEKKINKLVNKAEAEMKESKFAKLYENIRELRQSKESETTQTIEK